MASNIPPKRRPCFLFHHEKAITEDLVEKLIRTVAPVGYLAAPRRAPVEKAPEEKPPGSPEWEAQAQRLIQGAKRDQLWAVGWSYPFDKEVLPGRTQHLASQVYIMLRMHAFEVRPHQVVTLPHLMADQDHWVMINGSSDDLSWPNVKEMNWFLDRVRPFLSFFAPNFGFAEVENAVVRNLKDGTDPRTLAWPLMVFGPEEVKRIGQEKLEDAPAWKVERLPNGGMWVQAWENPFDAPQKQVTALAKHLGLKARGA